jgi:hypothetical protein
VVEVAARVQMLAEAVHLGPQWAAFERCRQIVAEGVAAELLPSLLSGALEPSALSAAFRRAFYMNWLGLAVRVLRRKLRTCGTTRSRKPSAPCWR